MSSGNASSGSASVARSSAADPDLESGKPPRPAGGGYRILERGRLVRLGGPSIRGRHVDLTSDVANAPDSDDGPDKSLWNQPAIVCGTCSTEVEGEIDDEKARSGSSDARGWARRGATKRAEREG